MRVLTILLALATSFGVVEARHSSSSTSIRTPGELERISVTSQGRKTGQFAMQGRGGKKSILLTNNIFYKPSHDHDADHTADWQIGDVIRVLKTKDKKKFILVNQRTGETMKGTILNWD
ncbi:MAG: hypothetical protein JSR37_00225 [Verrucomicrobia bacterium]|nr:hypothetical protein [Verrucomicrobiota bacterium]MBS0636209.1 hypothetical protein [Verrucomicrobiota bacterium]